MAQPRGTPETWEAEASPLPAVRRSPRLSKQAAASPAMDQENAQVQRRRTASARQGRAATATPPSVLKRGLEPRASPTETMDELPAEMAGLPSDSPAHKKSRGGSEARKSRVSFGGVQLRKFDKNAKKSPARKSRSPAPARASPRLSMASPAESTVDNTQNTASSSEQFFSPSSYQSGSPQEETVPVPSLKDLLDEDATATIGLNSTLGFDEHDETKPVPRLSQIGDFDDTAPIEPQALQVRDSMAADSTAVIAHGLLNRPSLAPAAAGLTATPTASDIGPSLQGLVQRAQNGEANDTQNLTATTSVDSNGSEDLDGSMEMTECYGGIVEAAARSSPARAPVGVSPSLAAASMTTLQAKPPESPNLKKLLKQRAGDSPSAMDTSATSDADDDGPPTIGSMIPSAGASQLANQSLTPQMKAMMKRKGTSMLEATADMAPPSPVEQGEVLAAPALLYAGSRVTGMPSGASPSPAKPPHSPLSSPVQAAQSTDAEQAATSSPLPAMPNLDAMMEDAHQTEPAESAQEAEETEDTVLDMPMSIPEAPQPSPVQQKGKSRQSSMAPGQFKDMIRHRSSMAPGNRGSLMPVQNNRASNTTVVCQTVQQFLSIADIRFHEDLSTNRRNTFHVKPGDAGSQTLADCIAVSTTTLPELRKMQDACDGITVLIQQAEDRIGQAEKSVEGNPPALFGELAADTRGEAATVIRGKLATLKRNVRKEAKYEWYQWFKNVISAVSDETENECKRLEEEENTLVSRAAAYTKAEGKLRKYMADLGIVPLDGRHQARTSDEIAEVEELEKITVERKKDADNAQAAVDALRAECAALENRKAALTHSVESLTSKKGYLMGNAESAAMCTLEDAKKAQQRLAEMTSIEGVTLRTMRYDEIVVDLCNIHRVQLQCEGNNVAETQLKLFEAAEATSFGEVDVFWRGLGKRSCSTCQPICSIAHIVLLVCAVEEAELDSVVTALCDQPRNSIPHALTELSFRIGRCHELVDEVNSIQRCLKVRSADLPRLFAARDLLTPWRVLQLLVERARGCVEVHVSHLPLNRKLTVSFGELCYGYPSGEITVDVTHHCGDVSAETAQVRRPISEGRLRIF